jgi:hypothetical protein
MKCATCKVSFAQHELRPYPPAEGESECIGCLYKRLGSANNRLCKDCKHWVQWEERDENVGNCHKLTAHVPDYARLRVYSDSDPISTEINFGCIHWEWKI